jgi:hypothetical protein
MPPFALKTQAWYNYILMGLNSFDVWTFTIYFASRPLHRYRSKTITVKSFVSRVAETVKTAFAFPRLAAVTVA